MTTRTWAALWVSCVLFAGCGPSVAADPDPTSDTEGYDDTWNPTDVDPTDTCADGDCCSDADCCGDDGCWDTETDTIDPTDTDTSEPPGGCDGIDCGNGACSLDEAGAPICTCDPGNVAIGLSCMPCVASDGALDIDVPMVTLTLQITFAGEPAPQTASQSAGLSLLGPDGDVVELGTTDQGELTVDVVPGKYRLIYSHLAGDALPRNSAAVIDWIDLSESSEAAYDLTAVELVGSVTVDGQVPPQSQYENGRISLVTPGGDEVTLGETADGSYTTRVLPGNYEVEYGLLAGGAVLPVNAKGSVAVLQVLGDLLQQQIDVDIASVAIEGAITIAGAAPPSSEVENGRISLVGAPDEPPIVLGETRDGGYTARVLPGNYVATYELVAGGTVVPGNTHAELFELAVGLEGALDIDVPTVSLAGAFTLDGAPPPMELGGDGVISLVNESGDAIELGHIGDGSYERVVVPGAYDVVYGGTSDGSVLPANSAGSLASVLVDGTTLDIDVPTVSIVGAITIDGMAPPTMDDGGTIALVTARGDTVELGDTAAGSFQTRVIPGDYEVSYAAQSVGVVAPSNPRVRFADILVVEDVLIDLDLPTLTLAGAITIAGAAPPADPSGELRLWDPHTLAAWTLASTAAGAHTARLVPTRYVIRYGVPGDPPAPSAGIPANRNAALACIDLSP